MPWGLIDDKMHANDKVRDLRKTPAGREALGTWLYWFSRCCDDPAFNGVVPSHELTAFYAKAAKHLVRVGLWDAHGTDYRFHDFGDWNPSKAMRAEKREAKRAKDRDRIAGKRAAESKATNEDVARDIADDNEATSPPSRERPLGSHSPSQSREEREGTGVPGGGPSRRVSAHCAWLAWNLQAQPHGMVFDERVHAADWQAIANACNAKTRPALALDTLCAWLWTAPNGPVGAGRVKPSRMTPKRLAGELNSDLDNAYAWWTASQENAA
jgi:hypothetical protein